MTTFTGTAANESIQPGNVSGTVTRPIGAVPDAGADSLNGGGGNDTLDGGGGLDSIFGGTGDDRIVGRAGAFSYNGGTDTDTFDPFGVLSLVGVALSGFEILELDASTLTLSAAQLADFDTIARDSLATTGNIVISAAGLAITEVTELATLTVAGSSGNDTLAFTTSGATLTDITIDGNAGNDSLVGGGGDDSLDGGLDNDTLLGKGGNDSLVGGSGADSLSGGDGNDTLDLGAGYSANGGIGNDLFRVFGNLTLPATIEGGDGTDTFEAQGTITLDAAVVISGIENLAVDSAVLTLTSAQLTEFFMIIGDAGATTGNIVITGGGILQVGVGGTITLLNVTGSAVADNLIFNSAATADLNVDAGDGDDFVYGEDGQDTLRGGAGNDTLRANTGSDSLEGNDGNDVLLGADGDSLAGGLGDDFLRIQVPGLYATGSLDGGDGIDTLSRGSGALNFGAAVLIQNIEILALDDTFGAASMTTAQLDGFTTIDGTSDFTTVGSLTLIAGGTAQVAVDQLTTLNVTATAGTYDLTFTSLINPLTAMNITLGAGNDTINTNDGADSIIGGAGNDRIVSDGGADTVTGGAGNDSISVRTGDSVDGGGDNDLLTVGDILNEAVGANTTIQGGGGQDTLTAGGTVVFDTAVVISLVERLALDADVVSLSAAQLDSFEGIIADGGATTGVLALTTFGAAAVEVSGLTTLQVTGTANGESLTFNTTGPTDADIVSDAGAGNDTLVSDAGDDALTGDDGDDSLSGLGGLDLLLGGDGNDTLLGGGGADTMTGGDGADLLIGGAGRDRLKGQAGSDLFRFNGPADAGDNISDFVAGDDLVQISAAGFGGGLLAGAALAAGQLVVQAGSKATSATGVGQFIFNTDKSLLLWDADGSGGAKEVKIAKFGGVASLATSDFEIIA